MDMWEAVYMRRSVATATAIVLLGGLAFGAYRLASGIAAPDPVKQADEALETDRAAEPFRGQFGDFVVSERDETRRTCAGPYTPLHDMDVIKESELYAGALGEEVEAGLCPDGSIVGLYVFGDVVIFRGYFYGEPHVPFNAPRDRLQLMTVAGMSAIAEVPVERGLASNAQLVVIERLPDGATPGIQLGITTVDDLEKALALAEDIIRDGTH
ncbi:MAG: hypothetical protein WEB04_05295 [Dehalococcoidia bacterium]